MSCVRCERCDRIIDSDFDPECFVEVPWLNMAERVWCEPCRDAEWTENEDQTAAGDAMAERAANASDADPIAPSPDNSTRS